MPREIEKEIQYLADKYFENFAGATPPIEPAVTKILREVLNESTIPVLEPLVISVAKDGMILTRNTLLVAKAKRDTPPPKPTPMPARYDSADEFTGIPMPDYVREMFNQYRESNRRGI